MLNKQQQGDKGMVFAVVIAAVFGAISLYMLTAARYSVTRKMAWIPLSMAAMELAMGGALLWWDYLVLTVILMVCRLTVLSCCVAAMKKDAAMARNRRRRREVWRYVTAELAREAGAAPVPLSAKYCA